MKKFLKTETLQDLKDKGAFTEFQNDPQMWEGFGGASGNDSYFMVNGVMYVYAAHEEQFQAYTYNDEGASRFYLYEFDDWILINDEY